MSDEEDYSASVNAIIQRRASTKRSKKQTRRTSSPFGAETSNPDRRRSSVFTTSSGEYVFLLLGLHQYGNVHFQHRNHRGRARTERGGSGGDFREYQVAQGGSEQRQDATVEHEKEIETGGAG